MENLARVRRKCELDEIPAKSSQVGGQTIPNSIEVGSSWPEFGGLSGQGLRVQWSPAARVKVKVLLLLLLLMRRTQDLFQFGGVLCGALATARFQMTNKVSTLNSWQTEFICTSFCTNYDENYWWNIASWRYLG